MFREGLGEKLKKKEVKKKKRYDTSSNSNHKYKTRQQQLLQELQPMGFFTFVSQTMNNTAHTDIKSDTDFSEAFIAPASSDVSLPAVLVFPRSEVTPLYLIAHSATNVLGGK